MTTCATCEAAISMEEWHPAVTERTEYGDAVIRSFCSVECREQWPETDSGRDEHASDSTAE